MKPRRSLWLYGLFTLMGVVLALVLFTPAQWVALALSSASGGTVRIAQADGSAWHGEGVLVFATKARERSAIDTQGFAVPGRLTWHVSLRTLVNGAVTIEFIHPALESTLVARIFPGQVALSDGKLRLPPLSLAGLGAPWNSLRPSAGLSADWHSLVLTPVGPMGHLRFELTDASSQISPVRPLGTYRMDLDGRGAEADFKLATLGGALHLEGSGRMMQGRLKASAQARCAARCEDLIPLLAMIGRQDGAVWRLNIGQ